MLCVVFLVQLLLLMHYCVRVAICVIVVIGVVRALLYSWPIFVVCCYSHMTCVCVIFDYVSCPVLCSLVHR